MCTVTILNPSRLMHWSIFWPRMLFYSPPPLPEKLFSSPFFVLGKYERSELSTDVVGRLSAAGANKAAGGLGGAVSPPNGVWGEAPRKFQNLALKYPQIQAFCTEILKFLKTHIIFFCPRAVFFPICSKELFYSARESCQNIDQCGVFHHTNLI